MVIILCIVMVALMTWAALVVANPISKVMSKTAINIATRLMGLLLAAIAVELIAGGLSQLLPGLTK